MDHKMYRALDDIQSGIQRRDHNRQKRTVGAVVKPRPKSAPAPRDPYHRSDEQIAAARALEAQKFPDP
jgi:hypothetical protein